MRSRSWSVVCRAALAIGSVAFFWNAVASPWTSGVARAEPLRVALTFDDSLKDHALVAAPMLNLQLKYR